MKAARADIRLELQKNLKARNLGLPDVENFALNQAKQRHSNKFKDKRISVQIQSDMNVKLRDAYQANNIAQRKVTKEVTSPDHKITV